MNISQTKRFIHETLFMIKLESIAREDLAFKTGIVESGYNYLYELNDGPARGFWQVQPTTAYDNFIHYLNYEKNSKLRKRIIIACGLRDSAIATIEAIEHTLTHNMRFGLCMCVVWYKRRPEPLPPANNNKLQGDYWDRLYNHPEKGLNGQDFENKVEEYLS